MYNNPTQYIIIINVVYINYYMNEALIGIYNANVEHIMFYNLLLNGILLSNYFLDYIDEVLQEDGDERESRRDGDDGGITFTAKSPRRYSAWYFV